MATLNAQKSREYLVAACGTHTGREALRSLGYGSIIEGAESYDDDVADLIAEELLTELGGQYPAVSGGSR